MATLPSRPPLLLSLSMFGEGISSLWNQPGPQAQVSTQTESPTQGPQRRAHHGNPTGGRPHRPSGRWQAQGWESCPPGGGRREGRRLGEGIRVPLAQLQLGVSVRDGVQGYQRPQIWGPSPEPSRFSEAQFPCLCPILEAGLIHISWVKVVKSGHIVGTPRPTVQTAGRPDCASWRKATGKDQRAHRGLWKSSACTGRSMALP